MSLFSQAPAEDTRANDPAAKDAISKLVVSAADPMKWFRNVRENPKTTGLYVAGLAFVCFVWIMFSEGHLSCLLTMSSVVATFAFGILLFNIEFYQSSKGLSTASLEIYTALQVARTIATAYYEGYVPHGASGDWLYSVSEALGALFVLIAVFRSRTSFTNDDQETLKSWYFIIPCVILGLIFKANLNSDFFTDSLWASAMYMEAIAPIPQLWRFQMEKEVHPWTAHFLAAQTVSKMFALSFWFLFANELNGTHITARHTGTVVLCAQIFQVLLMCDFMLQYAKCLARGVSVSRVLFDEV